MHWFSFGVALLAAVGIIGIGVMYLLQPRVMTHNFGLPLPEEGRNIVWWLRLKGPRDIVSGLVVLALMAWGSPYLLGIILLIEAIVPIGDMSLILAAKGSTKTALGVHGLTAALMILAAISLLMGMA
ncbi:MAG: DUF4267 domain-containing protein [Janthinobacterium lividum]